MAAHRVDFRSMRTGDSLYDLVMVNATRRICADLPDLKYTITRGEVHISGVLNDADYKQYQKFMSGGEKS